MDEKNLINTELDPEVVKVRDKIISKIGSLILGTSMSLSWDA